MSIKMIAIDVDGTLVNSDLKIDPGTIKAIKAARQKGIKVVVTTGRPLMSTKPLLAQLGLADQDDQYVINYHGCEIQTTSGHLIADHHVSLADVKRTNDYIQHFPDINFILQTNSEMYLTKPDINWYTAHEATKNLYETHYRPIDQLLKEAKEKHLVFYKMMFAAPKAKLDPLEKQLPAWTREDYKQIRSESYFIDMINKVVNKGNAVKTLAHKLGFKPEEIMAIGDGNSDVPMVKFAGEGVAMKNGSDAVLAAADHVTATDNNHLGLAKAIEKYALQCRKTLINRISIKIVEKFSFN